MILVSDPTVKISEGHMPVGYGITKAGSSHSESTLWFGANGHKKEIGWEIKEPFESGDKEDMTVF